MTPIKHHESQTECVFCHTTFVNEDNVREHLFVRHWRTEFTAKGYSGSHPVQSPIRGNLKIVQLPAERDVVVLIVCLNNRKAETQLIFDDQLKPFPIKLDLSACNQMIKFFDRDGTEDDEEWKIEGRDRTEFWTAFKHLTPKELDGDLKNC